MLFSQYVEIKHAGAFGAGGDGFSPTDAEPTRSCPGVLQCHDNYAAHRWVTDNKPLGTTPNRSRFRAGFAADIDTRGVAIFFHK